MKNLTSIFLGLILAAFLLACSKEPDVGPVEVKWDRDTCVRCNMALSDKRFAAQLRGGPKRQVFKLDDFGCAVIWLKNQPWADDPSTEFWVAATDAEGKWLDARKAYYVPGKMSPMGYGFGAVSLPIAGSVNYEEARKRVLAKGE